MKLESIRRDTAIRMYEVLVVTVAVGVVVMKVGGGGKGLLCMLFLIIRKMGIVRLGKRT